MGNTTKCVARASRLREPCSTVAGSWNDPLVETTTDSRRSAGAAISWPGVLHAARQSSRAMQPGASLKVTWEKHDTLANGYQSNVPLVTAAVV